MQLWTKPILAAECQQPLQELASRCSQAVAGEIAVRAVLVRSFIADRPNWCYDPYVYERILRRSVGRRDRVYESIGCPYNIRQLTLAGNDMCYSCYTEFKVRESIEYLLIKAQLY